MLVETAKEKKRTAFIGDLRRSIPRRTRARVLDEGRRSRPSSARLGAAVLFANRVFCLC
jgi:hypothetical protein